MRSFVGIVFGIIPFVVLIWQLFSAKAIIPTVYSWIMRIPERIQKWIIVLVAFGMLVFICWKTIAPASHSITNQTPKQEQASVANSISIPDTNINYEIFLQLNKDGEPGGIYNKLNDKALEAFKAGDYAYAALILETVDKDTAGDKNSSWQGNRVILAGAGLAKNPTAEGYQEFHKSLDDLVVRINDQLKDGKGLCFGNPAAGVLSNVISLLGVVESQLPGSEQSYVEQTIEKIRKIQSDSVF